MTRNSRHLHSEAGVALITTLLLLTLLGAATAPLAVLARLQTRIGAYEARRQQARMLAWSALQATLIDLPQAEAYAYPLAEDETPMDAWLVVSDELLPEGKGGFQVRVTDEAGKLPLSRVDQEILASLPGMSAEVAAALLDWLDSDDDVRPDGAEAAEYVDAGYAPRNGNPPTVAELGLVAGMTQDLLWGEDTNVNGVIDRGEDSNGDGLLELGLANWISTTQTTPAQQNALINVNTATAAQLVTASGNQLTQSQAQSIVNYRQANGQFRSLAQLAAIPGLSWQNLRSLADRLRPVANVESSIARVNLNTAPEQVLQVLPGSTSDLVAAVVEKRGTDPFSSLAQLWDLDEFGPENAALLDWVALQGGPWRLQITAWPAAGKPVVHAEAIVSREGDGVRLLYWRAL